MLLSQPADLNQFTKQASTMSDSIMSENRTCPGCHLSVINESGGVVVAFGQSFFHVDCFKCAKCGDHVTAETNLLLLSDGSPICANCSYCCNVCKLPILDEAIMTGDDSYHAHCFNCKVCGKRIDELVFAKTSQGIYCMHCHNERVARSRRHQLRKKEQEAALAAAQANGTAGSSSSERQRSDEGHSHGNIISESGGSRPNTSSTRRPVTPSRGASTPSRAHTEPNNQANNLSAGYQTPKYQPKSIPQSTTSSFFRDSPESQRLHVSNHHDHFSDSPHLKPRHHGDVRPHTATNSDSFLVPHTPSKIHTSDSAPPTTTSQGTFPFSLPLPRDSDIRKSHDDGVRPLNVLMQLDDNKSDTKFTSPDDANLPSSRSEQRRFVNSARANSPVLRRASISSNGSRSLHHRPETPSGSEDSRPTTSPTYHAEDAASASQPSGSREKSGLSSPIILPSYSRLDPGSQQRVRTTSSQHGATRRDKDGLQHGIRQNIMADRTPSTSTNDIEASEGAASRPSSHGQLSPLSPSNRNSANSIRHKRQTDDWPSLSPTHSLNGRLSPSANSEQHAVWRISRSSSPTSPNHRVDVPIGIESETETDRESDERSGGDDVTRKVDTAPAVPPREYKKEHRGARPPRLNLEPTAAGSDESNIFPVAENEDPSGSEISRESSPVQHTSRSTFIAPALPPIRISMSGTDFSDFLKFGDLQSPDILDRIGEEPSPPSETTAIVQALNPPDQRQIALANTPASEITVVYPVKNGSRRTQVSAASSPVAPVHESPSNSSVSLVKSPDVEPFSTPLKAHSELVAILDDTPRPPHTLYTVGSETTLTSSNKPQLSSESHRSSPQPRGRQDSNASLNHSGSISRLQDPTLDKISRRGNMRVTDNFDLVAKRLHEALDDAEDRGSPHLKLDREFAKAITLLVDQRKNEYLDMKNKLDGLKRASLQYMDGLTVAQTEYEREVRARRDAESEVTRLRVLLSSMKLSTLSGEAKKQEGHARLTKEMSDRLAGLERDLSDLKVKRDLALSEVEELINAKGNIDGPNVEANIEAGAKLSRSITSRLDKAKMQYKRELLPLAQQRERLERELEDLKAQRDLLLEETTVLNVRNEELERLSAQYMRHAEVTEGQATPMSFDTLRVKSSHSLDRLRGQNTSQTLISHSSTTLNDDVQDKVTKIPKSDLLDLSASFRARKFRKWSEKANRDQLGHREPAIHVVPPEGNRSKGTSVKEHNFQQQSGLRFARCDHCGDKMWGSHLRCSSCHMAIHPRCLQLVHHPCSQNSIGREESVSQLTVLPPSMFGRDLSEQVRSDSKHEEHKVPVIVEKCISAVDALALDYEGVYRKTGGSGQSKIITQLFERGNYGAFDLQDTDRFNDICSVTSVLKTYFRSLPNPLFTYALHDEFISSSTIRDPSLRSTVLADLVAKLPRDHYNTARMLMLHLNRIAQHCETNLMTPRNLGVVFGPTLMRSRDASAEFSDMAGKALTVEWFIENAQSIFKQGANSN